MGSRILAKFVSRGLPLAAVLTAFHLFAAQAWAQKPTKPPDESATLQWVIALGVMVVASISAFMNPKRSHRA